MSGRGRDYPTLLERLAASTDCAPGHGPHGDCWLWLGGKVKNGYGQIRQPKQTGGKTEYVHRVAYEIHHGVRLGLARKGGPLVLHRCDVRACVNPEHLFLGDDAANIADMIKKGRKVSAYQKGETNNHAKLLPAQVRDIRAHRGLLQDIADKHSIAISTASQIRTRRLWPHLT